MCVLCLVAQSCPTLCDPMDCSLTGSSVHGDSPGKNTGVGHYALLQGIFPTQGSNPSLPHCRWIEGTSLIQKGSTFCMHLIISQRFHFLIASRWGLGCQHMNFGEIQAFIPLQSQSEYVKKISVDFLPQICFSFTASYFNRQLHLFWDGFGLGSHFLLVLMSIMSTNPNKSAHIMCLKIPSFCLPC